ncbi:MAG: hypothetical protein SH819_11145 [Cytophagales bacterium]|nr:hypothetical protein [Cytophagales bacterium]
MKTRKRSKATGSLRISKATSVGHAFYVISIKLATLLASNLDLIF